MYRDIERLDRPVADAVISILKQLEQFPLRDAAKISSTVKDVVDHAKNAAYRAMQGSTRFTMADESAPMPELEVNAPVPARNLLVCVHAKSLAAKAQEQEECASPGESPACHISLQASSAPSPAAASHQDS